MEPPRNGIVWAFVLTGLLMVLTAALIAGGVWLDARNTTWSYHTPDEVAAVHAPPDLHLGPTPPGGPSESPTGAGAGGTAAGGVEAGRIAGPAPQPVLPPQPYGITNSRMSPVGSSGSAVADRGNPIPPDRSLIGHAQPATPQTSKEPTNVYGSSVPL